jgi:hypothetical protein
MAADGGTSQGWIQDDLRWFGKYKLRGAMPPRGIFASTFGTMTMGKEDRFTIGVSNSVWDRFLNAVRPTYEIDYTRPLMDD